MTEAFVWDYGQPTERWTNVQETRSILGEIHDEIVKDNRSLLYSHKVSKCFECLNNNEPHLLNDRQLQCVMDCYNYTMCQNVPNLASCSFIKHKLILIIFSK